MNTRLAASDFPRELKQPPVLWPPVSLGGCAQSSQTHHFAFLGVVVRRFLLLGNGFPWHFFLQATKASLGFPGHGASRFPRRHQRETDGKAGSNRHQKGAEVQPAGVRFD